MIITPLGRFELFIDLIWVGIIGNLAEHFSDQAFGSETTWDVGQAAFEFIVLFLIAWRIWKDLQEFMSRYNTNGFLERLFTVWILILAMIYGNNAPDLLDTKEPTNIALYVFLLVLGSFTILEAFYALYIPHLRRKLILRVVATGPLLGLWIPAVKTVNINVRAGLVFAGIMIEYYASAFMSTPMADRLLRQEPIQGIHVEHWVERIQDFYIIILGEGVLSLIRGSPLGRGITVQAGNGILVLMGFYILSGFYFNGDQSRRYVHAAKRTWYRKFIWLS